MTSWDLATKFTTAQPPAISGDGGHNQLYKVVCKLVVHFKLTPEQAWQLLCQYNLRCKPRWSRTELIHKLADASKVLGAFWEENELAQTLFFPSDYSNADERLSENPLPSDKTAYRRGPDLTGFGPGQDAQLQDLASLRGISVEGLRWAQQRGVLVFGFWCGLECWGVTDRSGTVLEVRRLNGKTFPAVGSLSERKSHAVRGSCKRRPVGIGETEDFQNIALVEGGPDLLAAHDLIRHEQMGDNSGDIPRCAPVAMLSANAAIEGELLPVFKGKHIRIFCHLDASGTGLKGARHWQRQIVKAGALCCEIFQFDRFTDTKIKDLNDYLIALNTGKIADTKKIMPDFEA